MPKTTSRAKVSASARDLEVATPPAKRPARGRAEASASAAATTRSARTAAAPKIAPSVEVPEVSAARDEAAEGGISAYERERLENIESNRQVLEGLGLLGDALGLASARTSARATATVKRGLAATKRKVAVEPQRRSLRGQGKTPDGDFAGGVHAEGADGTVVVMVAGEAIRFNPALLSAEREATQRAARTQLVDAPFVSLNAGPRTDQAFLRLLTAGAHGGAKTKKGGTPRRSELSALRLGERCVAKVTPRDVVHLAFQPRCDALLLCVADKQGHVALWDVHRAAQRLAERAPGADADEAGEGGGGGGGGGRGGGTAGVEGASEEEEEEEAADGVLLLRPHGAYVSGLRWSPGSPSQLFSASYDGTVRLLDLNHSSGSWARLFGSDEHELSALEVSRDGAQAFWADNNGRFGIVDVRAPAGTTASPLALHERKVNGLSLDADGVRLASCSTDSSVAVWDLRQLGARAKGRPTPLHSLAHAKSCQQAVFAPDGSGRLLSTCYDDVLRVWQGLELKGAEKPAPSLAVKHNCNTGRWIVPFRAVWTPAADGLVVGSMLRQVHLIDASSGGLLKAYHSELMSAIPARNAAHPGLPVLAGGTASGRVHVFTTEALGASNAELE